MSVCNIPYIRQSQLSDTEKERLESIHISIFKEAKQSKAFREVDNRLQTVKRQYAASTSFLGRINQQYNAKVAVLNPIGNGNAVLNVNVLPLSTETQGELFQVEDTKVSAASPETLKKIKEAAIKMGIDIQDLNEYAKEAGLDITGINALADTTRKIIAIAQGKEDVALTEELVHIATQIVEQTNPKMVTEMIAKIDRFGIYNKVYEEYKDRYKLPNGKPDIRKIKKEAVDKLISEIIINNQQNTEQFPELREEANLSLIRKWWNDILDWIRGIYKKVNIEIFEEAAEQIIEGAISPTEEVLPGGVFFQLSDKQKDAQKAILDTQNRVKKVEIKNEKVDPLLLDSEEANNGYEVLQPDGTWKDNPNRVTNRTKAWYKKQFPNKIFSKEEKELNELKRKYGVQGHADLQEIHSRYYNSDGTKKEKIGDRPEKFNLESEELYNNLEKYYTKLIDTFPEGTLIFSEVIVYDEKEKEAGTLDFLAIETSGKAHILDWKFMNISNEQQDIAWYKQGAFNIQITRYKDILKDNYGIKEFGMRRAIPILMDLKREDKKDKNSPLILGGIAVGSVNPSEIKDFRLLPVPTETETTGYPALDEIISKLNGILKQVGATTPDSDEEREFKFERMATLKKAIRVAQVQQNIAPLVDVIEVMSREGDRILNDYNTIYKDRPASSQDSENSELSDFSDEMNDFLKNSDVFTDIARKLQPLLYTKEMEKEAVTEKEKEDLAQRKEILVKLIEEERNIRNSHDEIKKAVFAFGDKHVGERNLVVGLTKPEPIVKAFLSSTFRGVSEIGTRALDLLYKLTRDAQGRASRDALEEVQKLITVREKLSKRGGDLRKLVQKIYKKEEGGNISNKLIDKHSTKFYSEVDDRASKGGDLTWLKENINIEAYKKEAAEKIKTQIEYINKHKSSYPGSASEVEIRVDKEKARVRALYDIDSEDFIGWNNYIVKRHPLEKWYSGEYNEVKNDPDLLELYNFIISFNEKANDVGYIQNGMTRNFLPFIRKSMAEQLVWDGKLSIMANMAKNFELSPDNVGYGKFNEVTGELENSIPKYYTYDFTKKDGVNDYSEVSEDLFKNLIIYIQHVEKYKYLSEIEGQVKLIKTIEEFKGHYETTRTGKIIPQEDGTPKVVENNEQNAKMFDNFARVLVYGQKYVLSDTDTPLELGKIVNFVKEAINTVTEKTIGRKVLTIDENPKATSLLKVIDGINRGFQLKTLGLEFISGAVNWFGSNLQIASQAGHYFTLSEYWKNHKTLRAFGLASGEEQEMFVQLVNTFMPMKDDPAYEMYKEAGMSRMTRGNLSDFLMVAMRKPEQWLEKSVFLSLLQNSMVVDGRIVSIKEYVNKKHPNRNTPGEGGKKVRVEIQKEVEELKKTSSIDATKELKDGKLVIPGLDLKNIGEIQRLTNLARKLSRNATGGMSDGDINKASMNIWTNSMMVFKNWIPKLADTRFSEFRKVSDDFSVTIDEKGMVEGQKYDIGKIRLLFYVLGRSIAQRTNNISNILNLTEKGVEELDKILEDFRKSYKERTGEDLNITRDDFIDLIRTNLSNQLRELALLGAMIGATIALGMIVPDDDDDKAARNFLRYSQKVVDRFVSELSFFYNPLEFERLLNGGMFPAIGLVNDFQRFTTHFWLQTTGIDMDPSTSFDDVRKNAHPIKYAMKIMPITKSVLTYGAIFNSDFARELDVTIQKGNLR